MTAKARLDTRRLSLCAVMAAVMCALAPLSIPIGPISITGGTFCIYLTAYLMGGVWGTASTLVYLLVGLVGVPVFSGYMGGPSRLVGPTGGYLVGYLPMVLIAGAAVSLTLRRLGGRGRMLAALAVALQALGMILATAVLYAFGTAWYCLQAGVDLQTALTFCVKPFIPWDVLKMCAALLAGIPVRRALERSGLL